MARGLPEANLGVVPLRPQARAVDTFVTPRARNGEGLGMQLARSLAPLHRGLESHLRAQQETEDAATVDRARANAIAAKAEIEDVRSGKVFAGESKLYQRAWKEQWGRVEGQRIRDELTLEYEDSGLQSSTDPKEFDSFLSGRLKEKLGDIDDPDIIHGALGVVEQASNAMRLQNTVKVSENLTNGLMDTAISSISTTLDEAIRESIASGQPIDTSKVLEEISRNDQRLQFLKLSGPEFRKRVTDMAVDKVMNSPTVPIAEAVFAMLDSGKITTAAGKALPLTDAYWRTNRDQFHRQAEDRAVTLGARIAAQEKQARENEKNAELGRLAAELARGKRPSPAMLASVAQKFGADAVRELSSTASSIRSASEYDDTATMHAVYTQLLRGETIDADAAIRLLSRVRDPSNVGRLYDDIERVRAQGNGDPIRDLRRIPLVRLALESLENAAKGEGSLAASLHRTDAETSLRVQTGLMQDILTYVRTHPELTPDDLEAQGHFNEFYTKRVADYMRYATQDTQAKARKQPRPTAPSGMRPADGTQPQPSPSANRFTNGDVQ